VQPGTELSDDTIIKALQRTGLWLHFVPDFDGSNSSSSLVTDILSQSIASLPQMSTGQMQLFALTRALLRLEQLTTASNSRPVLLLDEATSSIDPSTESTMRGIIKEVFVDHGHTIVEITHRPGFRERAGTVEHSNMAVILSQGRIHEQGRIGDVLRSAKLSDDL
jgi:ABC-type multidrug transport system fused ATPase/permease subunit